MVNQQGLAALISINLGPLNLTWGWCQICIHQQTADLVGNELQKKYSSLHQRPSVKLTDNFTEGLVVASPCWRFTDLKSLESNA